MRELVLIIVCSLALLPARLTAADELSRQPAWKLVWHDEFNGRALDGKKWNVLTREQSKHNELQYYVPDEVYVEKGCLRLRSRVRDYGSQHYTTRKASGRKRAMAGALAVSAKSGLENGATDGGSGGEWERGHDSRGAPVVQRN